MKTPQFKKMTITVYSLGMAYPITSHLKLGEMLWVGVVLRCKRTKRLPHFCNLLGQAFADQMQTVKPYCHLLSVINL